MRTILWPLLTRVQRTGSAKTSLVGRLLDDYEAMGTVDLDHEYDIKMVGAIMYAGGYHLRVPYIVTDC